MFANVQLSAEEMRLVRDPAWILTKNSVIGKVVEMFAGLSGEWREIFHSETEPKISKGEQYKGLPWVMLDYPRVFGKEDVFAIRTMFWWGHCFSVALHLKGEYLRSFLPVILSKREELEAAGFTPGVAEEEWEHAVMPGAWDGLSAWRERGFGKLAVGVSLDRWNEAPGILTAKFKTLTQALVTS
jgi:hypothetical protein